ncbi:hypothetical protein WN943_004385 [Citrus x changshan-huyou]
MKYTTPGTRPKPRQHNTQLHPGHLAKTRSGGQCYVLGSPKSYLENVILNAPYQYPDYTPLVVELETNLYGTGSLPYLAEVVERVVGEHTKSTLTYCHGIRRVDVFGTQSFRNESLKMLEEERSRRQAAENELKNMQEEMNGVKSTLTEVLKYVRAQKEANAIETFDS